MALAHYTMIAAVDSEWGLSKNGELPWPTDSDLRFFRDETLRRKDNTYPMNVLIMGRKTYESIPENRRPLSGRINMIVSRTMTAGASGNIIIHNSLQEALKDPSCVNASQKGSKVFVIGGAQIYEQCIRDYLYLCDRIILTHFRSDYECDLFFPEFQGVDGNEFQEEVLANTNHFCRRGYTLIRDHEGRGFHSEYGYLDLLKKIQEKGRFSSPENERTKTGTKRLDGQMLKFDVSERFPLMTTKFVNFDHIIKEVLFILRGDTNTKLLEDQGVHYWAANTSEAFLKKRGLSWPEGDQGPCFPAGTLVLTSNGYKTIESVDPEKDLLFTHQRKFRKIVHAYKRDYSGSLYQIKPAGLPTITCTPEHPFWVKNVEDPQQEPRWEIACQLDPERHCLAQALERVCLGSPLSLTGRNRSDALFFLGSWASTGWKEDGRYLLSIDEKAVANFPTGYLLKMGDSEGLPGGCTTGMYYVNEVPFSFEVLDSFGDLSDRRIPDWIKGAALDDTLAFIKGFTLARGVDLETNIPGFLAFRSADLTYSMQRIFLRCGGVARISWKDDKEMYTLEISCLNGTLSRFSAFSIESIDCAKVENITVYNFAVEEDESYTVQNLTVHNCYGHQLRRWGAKYRGAQGSEIDGQYIDYNERPNEKEGEKEGEKEEKGVDQFEMLIKGIREEPESRRHILNYWNAADIDKMALPPCVTLMQFHCYSTGSSNSISATVYQRSFDAFLGGAYNIAMYSLVLYIVAHLTHYTPKDITFFIGDAHLYINHLQVVEKQLKRTPFPFPRLVIKDAEEYIKVEEFTTENFSLEQYCSWPAIRAKMAV